MPQDICLSFDPGGDHPHDPPREEKKTHLQFSDASVWYSRAFRPEIGEDEIFLVGYRSKQKCAYTCSWVVGLGLGEGGWTS